jgi:AraC family transcriptional regulator
MADPTIDRKELDEQPILYIRRQVRRTELPQFFAECYPRLYGHGAQAGLAIAGQPAARYITVGPGQWTVDAVMPLRSPAATEGEITAGTLQGGPAAVAIHMGPYEQLEGTYRAVEKWIAERGYRHNGPPWEVYVTDPGQEPDSSKWKTEVYWPIAE